MSLDIRSIVNSIWDFVRPEETDWEFVTSDGVTVTAGLPIGKLISGGLSGGRFYVKNSASPAIHKLTYGAMVAGVGLGTPVSVSHSEFDWPAQGWGKIWKIPMTWNDDPPNSFAGPALMFDVGASVSPLVSSGLGAYGAMLVFLGGNPVAWAVPQARYFVGTYKYVGVIYGSFAATPGVGLNAYLAEVVPTGTR